MPIVAAGRLGRLSVAALVWGNDVKAIAQHGSHDVVPVRRRCQPMQCKHRHAITAPVDVSHSEVAHIRPSLNRLYCHIANLPMASPFLDSLSHSVEAIGLKVCGKSGSKWTYASSLPML